MSEDRADVVGTTGSIFTLTISSGEIESATLEDGKTSQDLVVSDDGHSVTVPGLPSGDSFVSMAMIWSVGDTDAIVDVGTVTKGEAHAADPKPIIDLDDNPGTVDLFGKTV